MSSILLFYSIVLVSSNNLFVSGSKTPKEVSREICLAECPSVYCARSEEEFLEGQKRGCSNEACKCGFDFRRDPDTNACHPTEKCRPFACKRPNEFYSPCPPLCPNDDCNGACLSNIFGLIMRIECVPKCQCVDKFKRSNGICVPEEECHS